VRGGGYHGGTWCRVNDFKGLSDSIHEIERRCLELTERAPGGMRDKGAAGNDHGDAG
jgi:hypothetical protein